MNEYRITETSERQTLVVSMNDPTQLSSVYLWMITRIMFMWQYKDKETNICEHKTSTM